MKKASSMDAKRKRSKSKYKLVCFDLDGTIISNITNFWEMICREYGCDLVNKKEVFDKFMKNLITYDEWVAHDIGMWIEKGIKRDDIIRVIKKVRVTPGAIETIKELKRRGMKVAIISDGIDIALHQLIPEYKGLFDDILINSLKFKDNGEVAGWKATRYGIERKPEGIRMIAKKEGIRLEECVFVGDGWNDVPAAEIVGLSIAFNPSSEKLREVADIIIEKHDLREILKYIF
ncbi:MAG: HAD family phosphatase [Candidatus Woesearchaeota archaeon]|nr:HAD family phosphatase [Candidatus Woesearchaeota archaeon]